MKKLKLILVSSLLVVCSALFLTACGDEKKTPSISPEVDDDVIYYTNQTLADVIIELDDEDTEGTISWEDSTLQIKKGENEYSYKFVPEDDDYEEVTGELKVVGYELVDVSNLTIADVKTAYTQQDVASTIEQNLKTNYFANHNVVIDIANSYVAAGSYTGVVATVSTNDYIKFKKGEIITNSISISFNLTIEKVLPAVSLVDTTLEYTGSAVEPVINFGTNQNPINLTKGVDYELLYYTSNGTPITGSPINIGNYKVVISGLGEYLDQTKELNFSIVVTAIPEIVLSDLTFNGNSNVPNVNIPGLVENVDYQLNWQYKAVGASDFVDLDLTTNNFEKAGTYKLSVTGLGMYQNLQAQEAEFTISQASISNLMVTNGYSSNYNGSAQTPNIAVGELVKDQDYAISWEYKAVGEDEFSSYVLDADTSKNFVNAGEYRATITGINNYTGTTNSSFVLTINKINRAGVSIQKIDDSYLSSNNMPTINGYAGEGVRYYYNTTNSTDGAIEYTSETKLNAGSYYIYAVIEADNNYNAFKTPLVQFDVEEANIQLVNFTIQDKAYSGTSQSVEINIANLTKDTDYTLGTWQYRATETDSWADLNTSENNFKNVGFYQITITGAGNYTGTKTVGFEITIAEVSVSSVEELLNAIKYAQIINLTADIADPNGEISFNAYDYSINSTINMNGYNLNSRLSIRNYNVSTKTQYQTNVKLIINGLSSSNKDTIGADTAFAGIVVIGNENVDVTLNNLNIVGKTYGLSTNGYRDGGKITATNCAFKAVDIEDSCGAYLPAGYTYSFTDCSMEGSNGVAVKDGSLTLTNCTVIGVGAKKNISPDPDDFNSTGDGLVVDSDITYGTSLTVNVNGGTYTSTNGYSIHEGVSKGNKYSNLTITNNPTTTNGVCVDLATVDELTSAIKIASEINLTANLEADEINFNAYDDDINAVINMNGHSINSRLSIRNYNVSTKTQYNNSITLTINGSENSKETIGSQNSEDDIFAGIVVIGDEKVNLTLNSLVVAGDTYGFSSNGLCDGATVTAENCEFIANDTNDSCGAYLPAGYTYSFINCVFTGANGVYIKDGTLTLTDCTLTGVGDYAEMSATPDDYNATGDALTIDSNSKYGALDGNDEPTMIVNIIATDNASCTFNSTNAYGIREGCTDNGDCYASINLEDENIFFETQDGYNTLFQNLEDPFANSMGGM